MNLEVYRDCFVRANWKNTLFIFDEFDSIFSRTQQIKQVDSAGRIEGSQDLNAEQYSKSHAYGEKYANHLFDIISKNKAKVDCNNLKDKKIRDKVIETDIRVLRKAGKVAETMCRFVQNLMQMNFGIQVGRIGGMKYATQCRGATARDTILGLLRQKMFFELAPRSEGKLQCDSNFASILQRIVFTLYYYCRLRCGFLSFQDIQADIESVVGQDSSDSAIIKYLNKQPEIIKLKKKFKEAAEAAGAGGLVQQLDTIALQAFQEQMAVPQIARPKAKLTRKQIQEIIKQKLQTQFEEMSKSQKLSKNMYDLFEEIVIRRAKAEGECRVDVVAFSGTAYSINFGLYADANAGILGKFGDKLQEKLQNPIKQVVFFNSTPPADTQAHTIREYYKQQHQELLLQLRQQYFTNTWIVKIDDGLYDTQTCVPPSKFKQFMKQVYTEIAELSDKFPMDYPHNSVDFIVDPNGVLFGVKFPELYRQLSELQDDAKGGFPEQLKYGKDADGKYNIFRLGDLKSAGKKAPHLPRNSLVVCELGNTIGLDLQKQEYIVRFMIVLCKNGGKSQSNQTNFKDYKQAEGRARFARAGIRCFAAVAKSAIDCHTEPLSKVHVAMIADNALRPETGVVAQKIGIDNAKIVKSVFGVASAIIAAASTEAEFRQQIQTLFGIDAASFKIQKIIPLRNHNRAIAAQNALNIADFYAVDKMIQQQQEQFIADPIFFSFYMQALLRRRDFATSSLEFIDSIFFQDNSKFDGTVNGEKQFFFNVVNQNQLQIRGAMRAELEKQVKEFFEAATGQSFQAMIAALATSSMQSQQQQQQQQQQQTNKKTTTKTTQQQQQQTQVTQQIRVTDESQQDEFLNFTVNTAKQTKSAQNQKKRLDQKIEELKKKFIDKDVLKIIQQSIPDLQNCIIKLCTTKHDQVGFIDFTQIPQQGNAVEVFAPADSGELDSGTQKTRTASIIKKGALIIVVVTIFVCAALFLYSKMRRNR